MTSLTLNNGTSMPFVGLGTWQSKPGEVQTAVKVAIEAGYRLIDTAYAYQNEREVGSAIKEAIDNGIVKRSDLFVTTKLWSTKHRKEDVRPGFMESLKMLGLDYVDLYLIHFPVSFKAGSDLMPKDEQGNFIYDDVHYLETWKALEELVDEGLIRSIGLSNFNSEQIQDIIDHGRIKPANLQVELHPYFDQHKLVDFCKQRNISVTSYSSFGSPGTPWIQIAQPLLDDPVLVSVATRHGKTSAQVIIRWLIQRGIASIPKSITPSRIQSNFEVFDFELTEDDMKSINGLNKDARLLLPTVERDGKKEYAHQNAPHYPWHIPF